MRFKENPIRYDLSNSGGRHGLSIIFPSRDLTQKVRRVLFGLNPAVRIGGRIDVKLGAIDHLVLGMLTD
ncbi:MAG: hypothetical protein ACON5D_13180 [Rubripirellula sp.]